MPFHTSPHAPRPRSLRGRRRRGALTVEVAVTLPILFLLFFTLWEFSRANMLRQTVHTAAYEGARTGIVSGNSAQDAIDACNRVLQASGATNATVTVDPSVITLSTTDVTVSVSLPLDDNAWVTPRFLMSRTLSASVHLVREKNDYFGFN